MCIFRIAHHQIKSLWTGRLQFKLYHHIEKDNDSAEDSDAWVMGDAVTNRPCLVVTYTRP